MPGKEKEKVLKDDSVEENKRKVLKDKKGKELRAFMDQFAWEREALFLCNAGKGKRMSSAFRHYSLPSPDIERV